MKYHFQRTILFTSFLFGLYFALPQYSLPIIVCLLLIEATPNRYKISVMAILSILSLLTLGQLTHFEYYGKTWNLVQSFNKPHNQGVLYFLICSLALVTLTIWAWAGIKIKNFRDRPLLGSLILFLCLMILQSLILKHSWAYAYLWLLIVFFSKSFWMYIYWVKDQRYLKSRNLFIQTSLLIPFWGTGQIVKSPIPRGLLEIENHFNYTAIRRFKTQISGVKLLYWAISLQTIMAVLTFLVYNYRCNFCADWNLPTLARPNFYSLGFKEYMIVETSIFWRWFDVLFHPAKYIVHELVGSLGIIIAIVRMTGITAFRQVYKPHQSKSFVDFFRRIYFYYNELLVRFFFFPFSRAINKVVKNRRTRVFLSVWTSVLVGGFIIDLTRSIPRLQSNDLFHYLKIVGGRFPYFLMIGLALALSASSNQTKKTELPRAPIYKLTMYYIVFALTFCLGINYEKDSLWVRLSFLMSLIGF